MFLSCHLPLPAISGGRRRELELLRRLARRFDIHLLVVSRTFDEDVRHLPAMRRLGAETELFPAAPEGPAGSVHDDPAQLIAHRSEALSERVAELLAEDRADLIHVEGYYLMQHVPEWVGVPVLLGEQNVEFELERQRVIARGGTAQADLGECLRAREAELRCWSRADALAAVTSEDRRLIRQVLPQARVRLVPDGCDHLPAPPATVQSARSRAEPGPGAPPPGQTPAPGASTVTLVANFAYSPNVDAALHLCREILPPLREVVADIDVWLVGNDPPAAVLALQQEGVHVTGRVDDVVPYLDAADVVVCPLRIGGGVKVKVIESLRRGKAIVSTPIGAQGLPPAALAIREHPRDFAQAVAELLVEPRKRRELERAAFAAAAELPTWTDASGTLSAVYLELLGERDRRPTASDRLAGAPA